MARSFNKVFLIGYAADEPILRNFENGGRVANLTVVTSESIRRHESNDYFELTEWNRVVFWNQQADVVGRYIHKGSRLFVEGKLRTRSYTDKSGVKRYTTEIVSDNMIMLDNRNSGPDADVISTQPHGEPFDTQGPGSPYPRSGSLGGGQGGSFGGNYGGNQGGSFGGNYGGSQGGNYGNSYGGRNQNFGNNYGGSNNYGGGPGGYGAGSPSFGGFSGQGGPSGQGGAGFGGAPAGGNQPSYPNYQNPYGNMNSNSAPMSAGDMAAGAAMGAAMGAMGEAMGAAAPEPNPNTFSGVNGPISLDNAPAAGFGASEAKPAAPAAPAPDAAAPSPAPVNDESNDDDIPF